jgi:hypothetical protein
MTENIFSHSFHPQILLQTHIDLLLFDGPASLEIVQQVLRDKSVTAGSTINYFAKEKRGHRIVL